MLQQEKIIEILKNKNISPSHTRVKVYEYISNGNIHPTVDRIYKDLSKSVPTLSKTTVYNILKLFLEKEMIRSVNLNDNKMRYELARSEHAHLKCDVCDIIYDIPVKVNIDTPEKLRGTTINETHILLKGVCSNCLEEE